MDITTFTPDGASITDTQQVQQFLADNHFYPLSYGIDGDFGAGSKMAFAGYKAACTGKIIDVAYSQIGAQEIPKGSNRGPFVDLYDASTGDEGNAESWCADFQSWCAKQWAANTSNKPSFKMPCTAGAWAFEEYGDNTDGVTVFRASEGVLHPKRGDFVTYKFSHIGICHSYDVVTGVLQCVEGNTNADGSREGYEVILHPRNLSVVRALVRLPI